MSGKVSLVAMVLVIAPALLVVMHYYGAGMPGTAQAQEDPLDEDPLDDGPSGNMDEPFRPVTMPRPADHDPFGFVHPSPPMPKSSAPAVDDPFGNGSPPRKPEPARGTKKKAKVRRTRPLRCGEEAILAALQEPTSLQFIETKLFDVVDFLREKHAVQIHIDQRALNELGIPSDTPITLNLSGIPLRSGLELMLRELDLTWTIESDVLLITTAERAETLLITKTYEVADLLMAAPSYRFDGRTLPTTRWEPPMTTIQPGAIGGGMSGGTGTGMGFMSVEDDGRSAGGLPHGDTR